MIHFIELIGKSVISNTKSFMEIFLFAFTIFQALLSPKTYNRAVYEVVIRQIYFTAIQVIPLFLATSFFFGAVSVGALSKTLASIGLVNQMGTVIIGIFVLELAPLATVLLIALRSGSAINTEIAVMKVNHEIQALEAFGISPLHYLYVPRAIAGIISIVFLSSLFAIVTTVLGILFIKLFGGVPSEVYLRLLVEALSVTDVIIFFTKTATFGIFIVSIAILFGLKAQNQFTIPIAVLGGMVKVFVAIVIIEVLSLILRFI